jgi:hypothetical protein
MKCGIVSQKKLPGSVAIVAVNLALSMWLPGGMILVSSTGIWLAWGRLSGDLDASNHSMVEDRDRYRPLHK